VSRDPGLYLQDIADACRKVQLLIQGMELPDFSDDWRTRDAVLHNLEVIGEAVKRVPAELKTPFPGIPWKSISGFRDVLAHAYFSIDDSIIWDVSCNQMATLLEAVTQMLERLDS
jgi:uncharacterized protein with HEPN domain